MKLKRGMLKLASKGYFIEKPLPLPDREGTSGMFGQCRGGSSRSFSKFQRSLSCCHDAE